MNELNKETIELYSKQLRLPTFNKYDEVVQKLGKNKSYDDFL